ncbi:MAG: hypothetical protein MUC92_10780 [Fimbriimonadaceae bacterium]|nr:hypothetical protein [Fimbriimonadaceae bacterium]
MRKAALDVGSNSVLLLVSELQEEKWVPIWEESEVTGLGVGTKRTGLLSEDGMAKTLDAVQRSFAKAKDLGASEILAGTTMAARIAENSHEFLARAEAQDTEIRIISGEDEAELGFHAVASDPLFAHVQRISIIDPGGHSTELLTADRTSAGWDILFRKSYPIGALGLKEGVLKIESPGFAERLSAVAEVDRALSLDYRPGQSGIAVVLGATGTNLVSIREKHQTWRPDAVHGALLDYEEVGRSVGWLCDMNEAQRASLPGLERGREGTIHIGALILERFLFCLHVLEATVSVKGWRHALIERGFPKPRSGTGS